MLIEQLKKRNIEVIMRIRKGGITVGIKKAQKQMIVV
jgi:hypothetical protein